MFNSLRCIVLNSTYSPLNIISWKRALVLTYQGKASVVEEHPTAKINSGSVERAIPTKIVLKNYVKERPMFREPAQLTARNLKIRDSYTCQYCLRHRMDLEEHEFLTRDHVHPKKLGGKDVWRNVVLACNKCNNRKADYLTTDIGMKPYKEPWIPTIFEIWARSLDKKRRTIEKPKS